MEGSSELLSGPAGDLVSVIIPAYNAEAWIGTTLESALAQTYHNLEVILVDDGSQDGTFAIVETIASRDPRVRIVRQTNRGLAAARNAAIAASKGALIAPLDADDLWHPEKIAKQVALMQSAGAKVGLIYTWYSIIDEAGRVTARGFPVRYEGDVYSNLIVSCFISCASIPLIRRSCVEESGGYDVNLPEGSADVKLYLAVAERHHFAYVPEFLTGYRRFSGSMSTNSTKMKRSYGQVLAEARQRHPELPARLFRQAECEFRYWFGLTSLRNGRTKEGAALIAGIPLYDPLFPLRPLFRQGVVRGLRRLVRKLGFVESFIGKPFLNLPPSDGRA